MTFVEIMKSAGGILFLAFVIYGLWLFCGSIVDFLAKKFGENKDE